MLDRLETADCIVCEHAPPKCDALDVLNEVRERDADVPFFIVTDDERAITTALSAGVTDCVGPDRRELLAHRIDHSIDAYRTERALEQTRAILSGLADAVVTVDEDGSVRYANDGLERVLGYDPSEMLGKQLTAVIPAVLRSSHEESFSRYVETGERRLDWEHVETIAEHRDGHEVPVLLSFHNGTYGNDELITGIIRDVSERKAMEAELEASRERYRKLVAASPEAILVADTETGIIVDANAAAEELFDRPRNEIREMHQSEIHPPERREHYRDIFEEHARQGGITRSVDDLSVVRSDGEEVPVEISANVSEVDGQRVIHAIFKDISERKARERTLEYLRSATRRLMTVGTKTEICEIAVKAAGNELDLPFSAILLANEKEDALSPVAMTGTTEQVLGEVPSFDEGDDPVWSVLESGETAMFKGGDDGLGMYEGESEVEQEMVIPLGNHGVFLLGSPSTRAFDEYVRDFTEILATNVQSALDRAEREETLSAQRAELVELNRINEVIRDVDRTLVQATSREEIEETVVGRLASAGPYEFAWIGEYEIGVETIRAVADAGDITYLESADRDGIRGSCPVAEALTSGETVVVENVATGPRVRIVGGGVARRWHSIDGGDSDSLRRNPIRRARRSRRPGGSVRRARAVGARRTRRDHRDGYRRDGEQESAGVGLRGRSGDGSAGRRPLPHPRAQELGCTFTLLGTTMSPTGAILCFITASGASPETILDRVEQYDGILDTRLIHERDDECVFEVTYNGPSFVKALVDRGATLGHVEANEDGTRGIVELPTDADIRGMVEAVQTIAPETRVVAQREREKPEPTPTEFGMQLAE